MIGCLSHGCFIKPKKKGEVGTNSMCNCLEPLGNGNRIAVIKRLQKSENKQFLEMLDNLLYFESVPEEYKELIEEYLK